MNETTDVAAPRNDREFQVWEAGRRQGHREGGRPHGAKTTPPIMYAVRETTRRVTLDIYCKFSSMPSMEFGRWLEQEAERVSGEPHAE